MNENYNYEIDEEPYEYEIFKKILEEYEEETKDLSKVVKEVTNE